jgi:hypothetical protein
MILLIKNMAFSRVFLFFFALTKDFRVNIRRHSMFRVLMTSQCLMTLNLWTIPLSGK